MGRHEKGQGHTEKMIDSKKTKDFPRKGVLKIRKKSKDVGKMTSNLFVVFIEMMFSIL